MVPENLAGKRVLVLGLGRFGGGIGVSRFLVGEGARVTVTDLGEEAGLAESLSQLQGLPITFHLGGHQEQDFLESDLVVVNPAVKRNSPWLELARKNRIPLTAEMNLFFERCPAAIVAITGSNGKSTTTAMTRAVLEAGAGGKAGRKYNRVWLGGNIGKDNLLSEVKEIQAEDVVVLELSSFQLYDLGQIHRSPHVAILTNITPNHLDWHGTMDEYVKAKQNILRYQGKDDFAVFNRLDPCFREWQKCTPGQVRWYPAEPMEELKQKVPGRHNQVNAAAALAAGEIFGVDPQAARQALARYESLPHRLELVREFEGVRYYNDSIATTPESVIVAIESFP
ncbi:MAG TPA: UDP-N-acetylmuramoyl-L-alanine--D-glutamate ligase, partial [Anaerohalosphaeraceae bacterium]|nr:UDP-N-acetylmuramoyl-L-alanine--D-glutamate ligase [Anaerohalosphaeraceae bacterium]